MLRRVPTDGLTPSDIVLIRSLLEDAFGDDEEERFAEEDWQHALGGVHFVLDLDGVPIAHAALVERELQIGGHPLRTGYVEAVGTAPDRQGAGFGTTVMTEVTAHIRDHFELGALGTGRHAFYQRLGWLTWRGPSFVRTTDGDRPTRDEDGYIMVLTTERSPQLDLTASISCEWRSGDVW